MEDLARVATGAAAAAGTRCRFCEAPLADVVVDLGTSPLANAYLEPEELARPETFYPLCLYVCRTCWLVQLPAAASPEAIFREYAYFSSYTESWLRHAREFVGMAVERFGLDHRSLVIEVASNDGYLLQYLAERGIPVLGIEPARNVAEAARARGIPTFDRFFGAELGRELASQGKQADLVVANNVLAHVPDLDDFVRGFCEVLAEGGVWTIEVPHLLRLLDQVQFDTIYHEHFSYFSLHTAQRVLAAHGLLVFDVEELKTHGGSLRLFVRHEGDGARPVSERVGRLLEREAAFGLERLETYAAFGERVKQVKRELLHFLIGARERGESVAAYGAPAKGNTLLNYCGVRTDLLDYTVDRSPHKQGRFLPGTRLQIYPPERIFETRPDWLLILPWNLEAEIREQMSEIGSWGGRFVVPIPALRTCAGATARKT